MTKKKEQFIGCKNIIYKYSINVYECHLSDFHEV